MSAPLPTDFLGRGWKFPLRLDGNGSFELSEGIDDIDEAIRLVLGTAFGEKPMRPEFGCGIHDIIFDPINTDMAGRVAIEVRQSLLRWEPRIRVEDVDAQPDDVEPSVLLITITYSVRATNDRRNLVFPFYSIPAEA